jgi:hypothetical protein
MRKKIRDYLKRKRLNKILVSILQQQSRNRHVKTWNSKIDPSGVESPEYYAELITEELVLITQNKRIIKMIKEL